LRNGPTIAVEERHAKKEETIQSNAALLAQWARSRAIGVFNLFSDTAGSILRDHRYFHNQLKVDSHRDVGTDIDSE